MTADDNFVYVCDGPKLVRYSIDGGAGTELWDASPYNIFQVKRAGNRVLASTTTTLHSVVTDGTGGVDLLRGERLNLGLAVTNERAYAIEGRTLSSVPIAGGTPRVQNFDLPTGVLVVGNKLWVIDGEAADSYYEFFIQDLNQQQIEGSFVFGNQGASNPKPKPELMVANSTHAFLGTEHVPSMEVGLRRYPAQPLGSGSNVSVEELSDISAYTLQAIAADDAALLVSTDAGAFLFNEGTQLFEPVLEAAQGPVALTSQYVIWNDANSLRRSPRP